MEFICNILTFNFSTIRFSLLFCFIIYTNSVFSQTCDSSGEIENNITNKVSGNVDFTIIGNSQNPTENNSVPESQCATFSPLTSTSDQLIVPTGDNILAAHLYWSGAGNIDRNVFLNGTSINAQRCWTQSDNGFGSGGLEYFSAYANVTSLVQSTGAGTYTLTGFDNSDYYSQNRCAQGSNRSTLYGGWCIVVIFENESKYEDFTIFYYDGLRLFQQESFNVNILTNVFDQFEGSHVGVVSWEGDEDPSISGDDIRLNGDLLDGYTGIPYTASNNIFNGTNSFNGQRLYNADFDDFDATDVVADFINTEAADFNFRLTSGMDLILLNTIVFRIPNVAPDAVVDIPQNLNFGCADTNSFRLDYTYSNLDNASRVLDAGATISFYINSLDGEKIGEVVTNRSLNPGQSASGSTTVTLPIDLLGDFEVFAYIDDPRGTPNSYGLILELLEENNTDSSDAFLDQHYRGYEPTAEICEGESFITNNGKVLTVAGDYPFNELTKRGGCDSIGVFTLIVHPTYDLQPAVNEICEGDTFILPDNEEISLEPRTELYEFSDTLLTAQGCDSIINTRVLVKPNIRQEFVQQICIGESYILPDGTEVSEDDIYVTTLPGMADNGCSLIISTDLQVIDIVYPNAFAPNANGNNEGFKAILPGTEVCEITVENYHLKIFNRWGELVFETNDISDAWDGDFNDELSKTGFYVWHAEYDTNTSSGRVQKGGVTLVR